MDQSSVFPLLHSFIGCRIDASDPEITNGTVTGYTLSLIAPECSIQVTKNGRPVKIPLNLDQIERVEYDSKKLYITLGEKNRIVMYYPRKT